MGVSGRGVGGVEVGCEVVSFCFRGLFVGLNIGREWSTVTSSRVINNCQEIDPMIGCSTDCIVFRW